MLPGRDEILDRIFMAIVLIGLGWFGGSFVANLALMVDGFGKEAIRSLFGFGVFSLMLFMYISVHYGRDCNG